MVPRAGLSRWTLVVEEHSAANAALRIGQGRQRPAILSRSRRKTDDQEQRQQTPGGHHAR
jgi:hypothetical protein